jgi:hypothetical protein
MGRHRSFIAHIVIFLLFFFLFMRLVAAIALILGVVWTEDVPDAFRFLIVKLSVLYFFTILVDTGGGLVGVSRRDQTLWACAASSIIIGLYRHGVHVLIVKILALSSPALHVLSPSTPMEVVVPSFGSFSFFQLAFASPVIIDALLCRALVVV